MCGPSVKIGEGESKRLTCLTPKCGEYYTEEQVRKHTWARSRFELWVTFGPDVKSGTRAGMGVACLS